jgi:hypothetical protein
MLKDDFIPDCRQCPSGEFEMSFQVKGKWQPARYLPICRAIHVVPRTVFNGPKSTESRFINRSNFDKVQVKPVDNCPHLEELRAKGKIPWASSTINFLKR